MWQEPDRERTLRQDLLSLLRAWRFGRQYRALLAVYIAVTSAATLATVLPALVVKRLIDHAVAALGRDERLHSGALQRGGRAAGQALWCLRARPGRFRRSRAPDRRPLRS